jgi:hypothetical protein
MPVVLVTILAWLLAWLLFILADFPFMKLTEATIRDYTPIDMSALCPQTLAIQEVDLLSSFISFVSVVVTAICWRTGSDKSLKGEFWTATTVWPSNDSYYSNYGNHSNYDNHSNYRYYSNYSTADAIQTELSRTCASNTAHLHASSRTWNGTAYESFHIGTPSQAGQGVGVVFDIWYTLLQEDQWYGLLWVLMCSLVLQCERACRNRILPNVRPGWEYDPETPDATRWLEYAMTSPVQVFLVAVNVNRRQDELIWMLMAAQALLMYMGYLIELCLYHLHATAPATAPTPQAEQAQANARQFNSAMIQYMPVDLRSIRLGCAADTVYEVSKKDVNVSIFTIVWFLLTAFCWHGMIWRILISAFRSSEKQFNECQQQKVPAWIQWLLYTQCAMFTLFGVVQLVMAVRMRKDNARRSWRWGTMCYSVLSLTAKLTLDVLFIAGTAMAE